MKGEEIIARHLARKNGDDTDPNFDETWWAENVYLKPAKAIEKALTEAGFVIVPKEPTEAMIDAGVTRPSAKKGGGDGS